MHTAGRRACDGVDVANKNTNFAAVRFTLCVRHAPGPQVRVPCPLPLHALGYHTHAALDRDGKPDAEQAGGIVLDHYTQPGRTSAALPPRRTTRNTRSPATTAAAAAAVARLGADAPLQVSEIAREPGLQRRFSP